MVGISGNIWEFEEPLSTIKWEAPRNIPEDKVEMLRLSLQEDITNG